MTYEEFLASCDEHIGEYVLFDVRFKSNGNTFTAKRYNWDGRAGWVEKLSDDAFVEILDIRWADVREATGLGGTS